MPQNRMYDFSNSYGMQKDQRPPLRRAGVLPSEMLMRALSKKGISYEDYANQENGQRADNVFMGPGGAFSKMNLVSQASPAMSSLVNASLQPLFAQGLPPDVLFNAMMAAFQRQY